MHKTPLSDSHFQWVEIRSQLKPSLEHKLECFFETSGIISRKQPVCKYLADYCIMQIKGFLAHN